MQFPGAGLGLCWKTEKGKVCAKHEIVHLYLVESNLKNTNFSQIMSPDIKQGVWSTCSFLRLLITRLETWLWRWKVCSFWDWLRNYCVWACICVWVAVEVQSTFSAAVKLFLTEMEDVHLYGAWHAQRSHLLIFWNTLKHIHVKWLEQTDEKTSPSHNLVLNNWPSFFTLPRLCTHYRRVWM